AHARAGAIRVPDPRAIMVPAPLRVHGSTRRSARCGVRALEHELHHVPHDERTAPTTAPSHGSGANRGWRIRHCVRGLPWARRTARSADVQSTATLFGAPRH